MAGGPCDEGESCHSLLEGLENIDDEADDSGIPLVTTEDADLAKSCGITSFPTVAMFHNGEPVIFKGNDPITWQLTSLTMKRFVDFR